MLCDVVVSISVGLDENISVVDGGLNEDVVVSVTVDSLEEDVVPIFACCVVDGSEKMV